MKGAPVSRRRGRIAAFRSDNGASSAVEFALIATPFIFTLLAILQMGIYYMTQAALDSGVAATADALNRTFYSQNTPTAPTTAALQSQIASKAGALINTSTLLVDLQPFKLLTAAAVPIGTNAPSIGQAGTCTQSGTSCGGDILALRAQAPVANFAPGFRALLVVRSSILVRRQAQ